VRLRYIANRAPADPFSLAVAAALRNATNLQLADECLSRGFGGFYLTQPNSGPSEQFITASIASSGSDMDRQEAPRQAAESGNVFVPMRTLLGAEVASVLSRIDEADLDPDQPSVFRAALTSLLRRYDREALIAIAGHCAATDLRPEVLASLLGWLSLLPGRQYLDIRRRLLLSSLKSDSPQVRLAATTGLAWLADPRDAAALQKQAQHELSPTLRRVMLRVARRLAGAE
jgi:hypothetical protein